MAQIGTLQSLAKKKPCNFSPNSDSFTHSAQSNEMTQEDRLLLLTMLDELTFYAYTLD